MVTKDPDYRPALCLALTWVSSAVCGIKLGNLLVVGMEGHWDKGSNNNSLQCTYLLRKESVSVTLI